MDINPTKILVEENHACSTYWRKMW